MQLTIDFSKLTTLDAIKAKILKFLKDNMVQSGTVFYEIRESCKGGSPVKRMHYIMDPAPTLDTHAGMIAADWPTLRREGTGGCIVARRWKFSRISLRLRCAERDAAPPVFGLKTRSIVGLISIVRDNINNKS